jgi:hypothetical protein
MPSIGCIHTESDADVLSVPAGLLNGKLSPQQVKPV